jgi:hypothetical protein
MAPEAGTITILRLLLSFRQLWIAVGEFFGYLFKGRLYG